MKSLEKRIKENLCKSNGELYVKYEHIYVVINNPESKHYIHGYSGSGRYVRIVNLMGAITEALDLIGVDFERGNDAPRGGASGDYIKLTAKGRRQVSKLRAKRLAEMKQEQQRLEAEKIRVEAERQERYEKIASQAGGAESILVEFFKSEIHPAPSNVLASKNILGISWRSAREKFSNK